tara:strand:+ start:569 stop:997 length:429 start_codon:yes stop_codon:yes gene_type:complete
MSIPKKPYSEIIAKKVRMDTRNGVLVKDTIGSIQKYQNAPSSTSTFYKLYGSIISETKAEIVGAIGSVVVQQALDGDFKSQEFYLRSKGGWSPNSTLNEVEQTEDPDTDESAIDSLLGLLGKNTDPDENSNCKNCIEDECIC